MVENPKVSLKVIMKRGWFNGEISRPRGIQPNAPVLGGEFWNLGPATEKAHQP